MAVEGFVAAGLGVAVVPQIALGTARRDIAIRLLEVDDDLLTRDVGVAMPSGSYRSPAVAATVAVLEQSAGESRAKAAPGLRGSARKVEGDVRGYPWGPPACRPHPLRQPPVLYSSNGISASWSRPSTANPARLQQLRGSVVQRRSRSRTSALGRTIRLAPRRGRAPRRRSVRHLG
jgi:hypothetical protein